MAVALLPALVHPRLWVLWPAFLGAFTLVVGGDGLLAPRGRDVGCQVSLPGSLPIGEEGRAVVRVWLAIRRPVDVEVAVDLAGDVEPPPPARLRTSPAEGELEMRMAPRRRGTVRLERVWIRYAGPLGLAAFVVTRESDEETAVVPNLRPTRAMALSFAAERQYRAGLKIERYVGEGTEFESLKEFRYGDDRRSIDWKATARHHKLICRQFRAERNHQVVLAVDTGHLMCERVAGVPKVDHALTSALVLAYVSLKAGDRVGFFSFEARPSLYLPPRAGVARHQALARLTAGVEYAERETNFTLGIGTLAQRLGRRSLVVVLTDFVDSTTAELMSENLERLGRHHAVLFVALRDPGLAATARGEPRELGDLHRAVVAGALVRDRRVVLTRLRQAGIWVVDAEPGRVTPALLNAYLEIKRRERV